LTNVYPNNKNNKKKKNNKVKSKPLELRSRVKMTIFGFGVGKLFAKHFNIYESGGPVRAGSKLKSLQFLKFPPHFKIAKEQGVARTGASAGAPPHSLAILCATTVDLRNCHQ
jgi:hypothetical protein